MMIIPGDRDDLLLAVCMAAMRGTQVAGILITGGLKPDPRVWKLCGPALDAGLPVLTIQLQYAMQSVLYLPHLNLEVPLDDRDRMLAGGRGGGLARTTLEWQEPLLTRTSRSGDSARPAFRHMLGGPRPQGQ
jgi:phosphate acetyltransferase